MKISGKYYFKGYILIIVSFLLTLNTGLAAPASDSIYIYNLCAQIEESEYTYDSGLQKLNEALLNLNEDNCKSCEARIYRAIGFLNRINQRFDSAIYCNNVSYNLFLSNADTINAIQSLRQLVLSYDDSYQYESAISNSMTGLYLAEIIGDSSSMGDFYLLMGYSYDNLGLIDDASKSVIQSLKIYEMLGDSSGMCSSLISLGSILLYDKNYTDALDYTSRALEFSKKLDEKSKISASLNNLGFIYAETGELKKALEYFLESLELDRQLKDKNGISIGLNNVGDIYKELGDTVLAMSYYGQSLEVAMPDNKPVIALVQNNRAEVELHRDNLRIALQLAKDGLLNAQQSKEISLVLSLYRIIQQIYAAMGRYELAYEYLNMYSIMNDSLNTLSKTRIVQELKAKYNDETQKTEISALKEEQTSDSEIRKYLVVVIIIISVLIVSLLLIIIIVQRSRKSVRDQKQYFESLLEFSEDFIFVVGADGKSKYISPSYERKIGRKVSDRLHKDSFEFIHSEDLPDVREKFAGLVNDKKPRTLDFRMQNSKKEWITVHAYGQNYLDDPVINGVIVNFWDITQSKDNEKRIKQDEIKFREIFNSFPDIYFQMNLEGIITEISPSVNNIIGFSREELIGVGYKEFHHFLKDWESISKKFLKEKSIYDIDTNMKDKDGSIIHCSVSAEFYNDNTDKPIGIKGVIRDISQRVKNIQRIKESQLQLEEANNSKEKILSIIAHDLIGPIGTNKSIVDLIVSQVNELSEEEIISLITSLKPSLDSTYSLIENLLSWARIQQNKLKPHFEVFEINRVLKLIFELLKGQATKKLINLKINGENNVKVSADPNQTDIIFRNLISNAIKFSAKGSDIDVQIEQNDEYVTISVIDYGIGMTEDQLDRINRGLGIDDVKRGTDNEKGTGFGLIIVSEFVKNNRGLLQIKSEPNKGSTFTVALQKGS